MVLVVIEGIDGVGKSTQIELLKGKLDCEVFVYPTKKFQILRDYLDKKTELDPKSLFLLFLADIAADQGNVKNSKAKIVILDRYVFSTIAYELGEIPYEERKKAVESVGFLKPDLAILLDADPQISQKRKTNQKNPDRYEEKLDFLKTVRSNFLKLEEERFLTTSWHRVDATSDIESVHSEIMKLIAAFV